MVVQQIALGQWSNVGATDRPSSEGSSVHAFATLAVTADSEAVVDHKNDKGKEKMEEKKKEQVRIGNVEFVDLNNCEVPNKKLQYNNNDTDDEEVPYSEGMEIGIGTGRCSQYVEPNLGRAMELIPAPLEI
jgi:hypothetical protein